MKHFIVLLIVLPRNAILSYLNVVNAYDIFVESISLKNAVTAVQLGDLV